MIYFSELFNVDETILDDYGAFNISLINDLPLFVDPFLLYASEKGEYQALHAGILKYISFLRNKALTGQITDEKIKRWYKFSEVKQVWFGYSENGNGGAGLGTKFGTEMSKHIIGVFEDLNNESITLTSHLEKLSLFRSGVGRDNISDFTCNLIKEYLLEYTQAFAEKYIDSSLCAKVSVPKVYFDYDLEEWMPRKYYLPFFNNDYVLLTPKDILTKDENWINFSDMRHRFLEIAHSIPNDELRDRVNDIYKNSLPKNPKDEDFKRAVERVVSNVPKFMDYYIRIKEDGKDEAIQTSNNIVCDAQSVYIHNIQDLVLKLKQTDFYNRQDTFEEARNRVEFLKDMIENKDGYKLFYHNGKFIGKEKDLQLIFKLVWYATDLDVNAEVNNGRGPVDFKISKGTDKTLVEFKLAKNSKLKQNLKNQVKIYEAANDTKKSLIVILYHTDEEFKRVTLVIKELELEKNENIILIDACDNKPSASNVK
jgi:hypothetical protein